MIISKKQIAAWLLAGPLQNLSEPKSNGEALARAAMLEHNVKRIHQCFNDLAPQWGSVDDTELLIGQRWLCNFNGEPIVLELGRSFPTDNKPYYFWFEPYMDDLTIEWHEVTGVMQLPPSEGE